MSEVVRWYLEAVFLVVTCFLLGAGVMALVLRSLLPEPPEEPKAEGPTYTAGTTP
jgi:hypothetical protein